jgi:VIT1/CCC1 family predicted Fe2+/Mn2+ transporter
MKKMKYNWLPDFIYGGIDGTVTTFAVVAGVVGADLSTTVILILGFANLFADGFSMAIGKYSSDKAELDRIHSIKEDEIQSILEKPHEEREEVREIFRKFGFKGQNLKEAEKIITSNPKTWVKIMLNHEFNVIEENVNPIRGALVTILAFVSVGIIPILGYVLQKQGGWSDENLFVGTCFTTLFALFLVGTVKSQFTNRSWVLTGLETAGIGGIAAGIAYAVGAALGQLFGIS